MNRESFYITTPIFYPNGSPHMGHAYVALLCDVVARYHRALGHNTYFLTGTDEHSSKVIRAAEKEGVDPAVFTDRVVATFKEFYGDLNISYDQFIRTSDEEDHWPGVIEVWKRIKKNGDLYKDTFSGLYCVGCEAYVTEKDLVDGKCPDHDEVPEELSEENYFFKLSKYTEQVKNAIIKGELVIEPATRKNEILSLLDSGLHDISFSRPKKAIPWGIPVPGDDSQTIYVWCDALVNYISALGFGSERDTRFKSFWPADYHVVGKDILRFHAAIWPAMLLSAGIPLPKKIFVHGMILSGGRKMSKTLGNILDPREFIKDYGSEAVRYYLAREVNPFEDGDMTAEKFLESYNANLANGIGNLASRILKMVESYDVPLDDLILPSPIEVLTGTEADEYRTFLDEFKIDKAADFVWSLIAFLDSYIADEEPYKTIKSDPSKAVRDILFLVERLWEVAVLLGPLLPETSDGLMEAIKAGKKPEALFERK